VKAPLKKQKRTAQVKRNTSETQIVIDVNVDGTGNSRISTGIPFLDHMLSLLSKHSLIDLNIKAKGDLHIDLHHTNEDIAICLGQALKKALGEKKGIQRYGFFYIPMGDTLTRVVLDLSGRFSFLIKAHEESRAKIGEYALGDATHFLESLAQNIPMDLNIEVLTGKDRHHVIESIFKGLARALRQAVSIDPALKGSVPSTKGSL
jgi:imidazoleglycerol-phosphate dehydratase